MVNFRTFLFAVTLPVVFAGCVQSLKETQEYINAPVNLAVTSLGGQLYELSFYSDNREGGFAGYGLFTGPSATALNDYPAADITAAQAFCEKPEKYADRFDYKTLETIQVGVTANTVSAGSLLCGLTSLTLTSGNYIALRARVERTTKPWSAATIAQVP